MIASVLLVGFGGMAVVIGLLVFIQRVRLYTHGLAATGTVVWEAERATDPGPRKHTTMRAPAIEVLDASTGRSFQVRSSFSSTTSQPTIGARLPVRYMPGDPDLAEVDTLLPMWFFSVGSLTLGGILLAVWWRLPG